MRQVAVWRGQVKEPVDLILAEPKDLAGEVVDEQETRATIRSVHARTGYVLDPGRSFDIRGWRKSQDGYRAERDLLVVALAICTVHAARRGRSQAREPWAALRLAASSS